MANTIAVLGAGTTFAMGDGETAEQFTAIPGVLSIGSFGEQGEFIDVTPLSATTEETIGGMGKGAEREIVMNDLTGEAAQQAFLTAALARNVKNFRVTYPTGRSGTMSLALNGYQVQEPESNGQMKVVVYAKQNGAVAWTIT
jgi:hypothetical protein